DAPGVERAEFDDLDDHRDQLGVAQVAARRHLEVASREPKRDASGEQGPKIEADRAHLAQPRRGGLASVHSLVDRGAAIRGGDQDRGVRTVAARRAATLDASARGSSRPARTNALPTTTPSTGEAKAATWAGSRIPKPTAIGSEVRSRRSSSWARSASLSASSAAPVTPVRLTA